MGELVDSKTADNLRHAFAKECETSLLYLYFAHKADIEGHPETANTLRAAAQGETGHAFGHLDFLMEHPRAAAAMGLGGTSENLGRAISLEEEESEVMYPGFAHTAVAEGFPQVAEWFFSLALAEKAQAERLRAHLEP